MKWSISAKVKLIFISIVFCLIFVGVTATLNIHKFESDTQWMEHSHHVIQSLQKIYSDFKDIQVSYANYLLTQKQGYGHSSKRDIVTIQDDIKNARRLIGEDPILQNRMDTLESLVAKRAALVEQGLAYCQAGRFDLAIDEIRKRDEKKEAQEIKDLITRMAGLQAWLLKTRNTLEAASTHKNIFFIAICVLFAIFICGIAAYFINRQIRERQFTINLLRNSEERLRFLVETANDSFITVDSSGNITDLNPASEMLFEYPREELTGWPLERLMPQKFVEENGDRVFEKFVEMTTQVGIKTIELYARKKDGNEFPVEVSVSKWEIKGDIFYSVATRDITERKFFIKTLLNNEHRLFQFLDAVPIGIFVRDKSGMSYYANQTAKKIFGMDLIKNRIPIDKASQMYDFRVAGTNEAYPIEKLPVIRALKGEKSFVDDLELRHGNEITPLHSWGAPIFDEHDEIKYVLAAVMDVSRQKEITESLRSREEFFRNLFEEGPIGMTLAFPNSTLVNVNRAFCDMLGFTKDQLIGKSFLEFTHPEYIPAEQLLTQKLFDKMIPNYQVEERYMTKKGQSIWCKLSASVIRDLSGEPLFRLAVVENITDQKEAETALKESEEKFRRVFAESPLGMSFITKDGKIEEINKAFCEMLGYSSEELVNTSIYNITHPEDIEISKTIPQAPLEKRAKNVEKRYLTKDKKIIWVSITPLLMKEKDGKSLRILSIAEDITERKQIEEMKSDLISVVSHQLKTPVAEINGYIENMLEGLAGALTQKQTEYLVDMKEIGTENYRLISDLLNMSKIERGVIAIELAPTPLKGIVDLAMRGFEATVNKKGLTLTFEIGTEDISVLADQDKTVETLRNIINNAIKCTDKGGVTIQIRKENGFGVVEITDTGIGMNPQVLLKLFSKEQVMGKEASRAGAGLGLYIAKNFMNLQNGDITVKSEKGKGSSFLVKIPIIEQEKS